MALLKSGDTDDEIRVIFQTYPIGEKYREKGPLGDQYLAHSIGSGKAFLADRESVETKTDGGTDNDQRDQFTSGPTVQQATLANRVEPLIFPEAAWRGPFADYRRAMEGTSEAPDSAHFASLWAVAAAQLRRRVYVYYAYPLYPNVFLVNYGTTGDSKTSAARQGLRLI